MNEETKLIIRNEIAPLVQNGDITLFLGAGTSIGTSSINGLGIPSTNDLITRICLEASYTKEDAKQTDLPTAFGVGEDEIDNFENFLVSNFTTTTPYEWQLNIFRHWWRAIFTTNIDTIPESCIDINRNRNINAPDYQVFNYKDREPIQSIPTSPPVVFLHGKVSSASDGFVFDNVSYAENSVNQSDWLVRCALHISHGNCLFVGSKFKESDIETALRRRENWEKDSTPSKNWIVLKSFTNLEKKSYERRGIIPIEADAKSFFDYLFSLINPLTKHKFIKKKAPFLSDNTDDRSLAWFTKNMSSIQDELERSTKIKAPFSLFYNGDMPNWFYIKNKVPTNFSKYKELVENILDFEKSDEKARIFSVIGPLGSGKTTISMLALANLSNTHNNIYQFSGLDGIDIESTWSVIKDLKGLVVIFIDAASSYYYAVNEIVERAIDRPTSCKLCFVLEERTIFFERNKRHFTKVPRESITLIKIENLNKPDATLLYDKTKSLGINFEKLMDLDRNSAIEKLVNFDTGYKGDLLATLYDLSSRKSYREQLTEEYEEIDGALPREIFQTISLVTASRLQIPANYLCEIFSISIESLMKIINDQLRDKIHYHGVSMTFMSRHHSIAEYHLNNNFDKESLKDTILGLMKCVSSKFSIDDIRRHPISYKIYSKTLSYHYLTETLFSSKHNYSLIHDIYSECQKYFSKDGIFWLQYGRFLERDKDIPGALHCFRKGLALYDSFQLRHALGQLLLKKYRVEREPFIDDFNEGVKLLKDEINARGSSDPYPYTALGNELIKIYKEGKNTENCQSELKELINRGLRHHREDSYFSKMVANYISNVNASSLA